LFVYLNREQIPTNFLKSNTLTLLNITLFPGNFLLPRSSNFKHFLEIGEFKFLPALVELDPLCTVTKRGTFYRDCLSQAISYNFSPCMWLMLNKWEILGFKFWLTEWVTKASWIIISHLPRWCRLTRFSNVFQSIMHTLLTTLCYITCVFFHYWIYKELLTHPFTTFDWNLDNKSLHYIHVKIYK
jgi:hypothetical protein